MTLACELCLSLRWTLSHREEQRRPPQVLLCSQMYPSCLPPKALLWALTFFLIVFEGGEVAVCEYLWLCEGALTSFRVFLVGHLEVITVYHSG